VGVLEFTHQPDFARGPLIYGFLLAACLILRGWRDPRITFAMSIALAPLLIFNQQIVTGLSLQPFHYEQFGVNYAVLCVLLVVLANKKRRDLKLIATSLFAVLGVLYATAMAAETFPFNRQTDEVRAAAVGLSGAGTVFAKNVYLSTSIPSITTNPVLWARYMYTFSSIDRQEQKLRYFKYLYYSSIDSTELQQLLETNQLTPRQEIFGSERANLMLARNALPITNADITEAVQEYSEFVQNFDRAQAMNPVLSYAVVEPEDKLDNLDKWYLRDGGELVGRFVIYRLTLK
jgi:hypothetical protein